MKPRHIYSLFLVITGAWWGWTTLVDFFIVKAVFSTIDNFWKAGELGMTVFSRLNNLEVIASSVLTGVLALQFKKNKAVLPLLVMSLGTWIIAMIYFSYLTPKIIELTAIWHKADLMGITSLNGIPDIQQEHSFYHNLYIAMDSAKLLIISAMIGTGIWKQEKMF